MFNTGYIFIFQFNKQNGKKKKVIDLVKNRTTEFESNGPITEKAKNEETVNAFKNAII